MPVVQAHCHGLFNNELDLERLPMPEIFRGRMTAGKRCAPRTAQRFLDSRSLRGAALAFSSRLDISAISASMAGNRSSQ